VNEIVIILVIVVIITGSGARRCHSVINWCVFTCSQVIRQLRSEVSQLQLVLNRKDAEMQQKDARIAELENRLSVLTNGVSFRWPSTLPARTALPVFHDIHSTSPGPWTVAFVRQTVAETRLPHAVVSVSDKHGYMLSHKWHSAVSTCQLQGEHKVTSWYFSNACRFLHEILHNC